MGSRGCGRLASKSSGCGLSRTKRAKLQAIPANQDGRTKTGGASRRKEGRTRMKLKHLLLGTAFVALTVVSAIPAGAAEIYIPLLNYRTGPFAVSGAAIGSGMADYLNMLHDPDGCIG